VSIDTIMAIKPDTTRVGAFIIVSFFIFISPRCFLKNEAARRMPVKSFNQHYCLTV
jgi:collagenase-like PrtC family protease